MPLFDEMYYDQKWSLWDTSLLVLKHIRGYVLTAAYRMGNVITAPYRRGEVVTTQKRRGEAITTEGG